MKKLKYIAVGLGIASALFALQAGALSVFQPIQGGTGTSTAPLAGQIPIGNSSNTYSPAYIQCSGNCSVATSSGGITITVAGGGSGSGTVGPSTSTYVAFFSASSTVLGNASFTYNTSSNILTLSGLGSFNTLNVLSTATTNGITNTGNVTSTNFLATGTSTLATTSVTKFTDSNVTSSLGLFDASGTLSKYAGASACSGSGAVTTISAIGATTCAPFVSTSSAGTLNALPLWTSGTALGNSVASQNAGATLVTIAASTTINNQLSVTQTSTLATTSVTSLTVTGVTSALGLLNGSGVLGPYAGASACGAGQAVTTISAVGGTTCSAFATSSSSGVSINGISSTSTYTIASTNNRVTIASSSPPSTVTLKSPAILEVSTSTSVATSNYIVAVTSTSTANIILTLPSASSATGTDFYFKDEGGNASNNPIVISSLTHELVDGTSTRVQIASTSLSGDANLKSNWKLEDTSDSVGANTLTNNGTVTFVAGQFNKAANFVSASSQSLQKTSPSALPTGATAFTVSAWVNVSTFPTGTNKKSFYYFGTNATRQLVLLEFDANGNANKPICGTFGDDLTANTSLAISTWNLVSCTYDGSTALKLYINGVLDNSKALGGALNIAANAAGVVIGADDLSGSIGDFFSGMIDDVSVFNRTLSATEESTLYGYDLAVRSNWGKLHIYSNGTSWFTL